MMFFLYVSPASNMVSFWVSMLNFGGVFKTTDWPVPKNNWPHSAVMFLWPAQRVGEKNQTSSIHQENSRVYGVRFYTPKV